MSTPPTGPEQSKRIVDLLVLALSSSDAGKTLKAEAIRQLVQGQLKEAYDGQTLDLGPLWTALLAEPGLSEFKLAPAFLQFREWEGRLATTVVMPKPLASLDRTQAKKHLVRISVKQSDLDPLLYPTLQPVPVAPPPAAPKPAAEAPAPHAPEPAAKPAAASSSLSGKRKVVVGLCAAALALALVVMGVVVFTFPGSSYSARDLDPILRVERTRKVGHAVSAVIVDGRWAEMSAADRQQTLEQLFKVVEPQGVKSLVLRDAAGNTRAVASIVGNDRVFRVE
jgi:hypothetical protein